jgi:hypothetical protein
MNAQSTVVGRLAQMDHGATQHSDVGTFGDLEVRQVRMPVIGHDAFEQTLSSRRLRCRLSRCSVLLRSSVPLGSSVIAE